MEISTAHSGPERRREVRTRIDRSARHMQLNHPERGWGLCRVVDASHSGLGLLVLGPPWPRYPSDWQLLIHLEGPQSSRDPADTFLEVAVRHAAVTDEGWLRIGADLVTETPAQTAAAADWIRSLDLGEDSVQ